MPQFAKLLARGSCAIAPRNSRGIFFCSCLGKKVSRKGRDLKSCALNSVVRVALIAAVFCMVAGAAHLYAEQTANRPVGKESFRTVQDETGRNVRVPVPVRRVGSLAPSLTAT